MSTPWVRATRLPSDNSIGPQHGSAFDFTLTFEEYFFAIVPAILLLLVTPFQVVYYIRLEQLTAADVLLLGKMGVNGVLIVFQVVSAGLSISSDATTSTATAASVLSCLAAVALAAFLFFEHRHAVESSPLPSLYLFVTFLLDTARARSYFLRSSVGLRTLACLAAGIAAAKLVLLFVEEIPKRRISSKNGGLGPETTRGFWARTFLVWVNSTIFFGFRNVLTIENLPNLDKSFYSAVLAAKFEPNWKKQKESSSFKLIKATFRTLMWPFLGVVPGRLLFIGFTFADPFILRSILQQVAKKDRDPNVDKGLIGAVALVRLGVAVTRVWHGHMKDRLVTKARGVLTSQIIRKSLLIDCDEASRSSAVSLMSTDVAGIVNTLPLVHEAWAGIIELGLGIYLISTVIKESAFLTVIPTLFGAIISMEVMRRSRPAYRAWNQQIEIRVAKTSKIIGQMVGIKMIGAENAIGDYIQQERDLELKYFKKPRQLHILTIVAVVLGYSFTPALVMAGGLYWSGFVNGFNTTDVFTTLAFVYLVASPLSIILKSWTRLGEAIACFQRIQAYLSKDERTDIRQQAAVVANENSSTEDHEKSSDNIELFPVQLVNASISSPNEKALFSANTLFGRSTITMVIGPTGSGKSTLLKALLGDGTVSGGSVIVQPHQFAYCDQTVWLRNVSIRSNIIGETAFDEEWYNKVIEACLLHDMDQLPKGHLSLAGSRGANLSGGQKQRVALARAIYSRAPVLLLDDVTSAVDRPTCSELIDKLLGPNGLLKALKATVIMTTHTVELLKFADSVLVIHADATVTMETAVDAIQKYGREDFLESYDKTVQDTRPAQKELTESEERPTTDSRQKGDLELYRYYLKSVRKPVLIIWLVAAVFDVLTEKLPDIYLRLWVDKWPDNKSLLIGYLVLGIAAMVASVPWLGIYYTYLVPDSAARLHRKLIDSVKGATLSFLTHTDSGSLLNRFSQDMSLVVQELPDGFIYTLYSLLGVISNVAVVAAGAKYVVVIIPVIFGFLYLIQYYYLRTSRQMRHLDLEAKTPLFGHLTESSEGLQHIRAFKWEQQCLDKGYEVLDRSQKPAYYMLCIQRWLMLVMDLSVAAIAVLLVGVGFAVASTNQAALGLSLFIIMRVGSDMGYLIFIWASLETSLGAMSRARAFERDTPQEIDGDNGNGSVVSVPDNWPNRGEITLRDVSAEYATPDSNFQVLHDLSLVISPGEKVGLVGRTGSGKSSLLLTLLNFLKYTGTITIDGIEISDVARNVLRSRITTISQGLIELPSSIRDNLTPHEIVTAPDKRTDDSKLLEALERVGLKEEIERRGGLDAQLSDVSLSAGEKQLFALARALLQNSRTKSKVVFVDEATSNIDYASEKKMQQVMTEAFADCTVLTIAHRLHTMESASVIHRMAGGRIVNEAANEAANENDEDGS